MTKHPTFVAFSALSVATLSLSSSALAQPAVPGPQTVVASPVPPAREGTEDANVDRGFLLPTAMTQPAGSVTYNNYELLLHGLTFGITDNVQATVTVLSPVVKETPFVGFASIKGRIPVGERLNLAFQGSAGVGHSLDSSRELSDIYSLGAGAFASVCASEDCASIVSASVTYQLAVADDGDKAHLIIYGGSVVSAISPRIKLLFEIASAAAGGDHDDTDNFPGFIASYGVRLHTGNMATDLGFVRPIGEDTGEFLMGLPFVSVSYRWQ